MPQQAITQHIYQVHVIGRRGPVQAAFTTKEFREILTLPNVETYQIVHACTVLFNNT
jgi:hypothetical protein